MAEARQKFQSTSLGQIRRPTDWARHGQPLVDMPLVPTFLVAMTQSPALGSGIKWGKNLDKVV